MKWKENKHMQYVRFGYLYLEPFWIGFFWSKSGCGLYKLQFKLRNCMSISSTVGTEHGNSLQLGSGVFKVTILCQTT